MISNSPVLNKEHITTRTSVQERRIPCRKSNQDAEKNQDGQPLRREFFSSDYHVYRFYLFIFESDAISI